MQHINANNIDDHFTALSQRPEPAAYFSRICGYDENIGTAIKKYFNIARTDGVMIDGNIPALSAHSVEHYNKVVGTDFALDSNLIVSNLKKWIPQMSETQINDVSIAMLNAISDMSKAGKPIGALKSTYVKFMCWLYHTFGSIAAKLGSENLPKVIYGGDITNHELIFLSILSNAGCDILLLEYDGDDRYKKLDPENKMSSLLPSPSTKIPDSCKLSTLAKSAVTTVKNEPMPTMSPTTPVQSAAQSAVDTQPPHSTFVPIIPATDIQPCTNAWITGEVFNDILTPVESRGDDKRFFYNVFTQINGVWDKITYTNDLYKLYSDMKNANRNIVIEEKTIPVPTTSEINEIKRQYYKDASAMISDLSKQVRYDFNQKLKNLMVKTFIEIMMAEAEDDTISISKLTSKAVYLLCWIKRYAYKLFPAWKGNDVACFIYFGRCEDNNESLLLRYFSRLPIDVIVITPDPGTKCCLTDKTLYVQNYTESDNNVSFPYTQPQMRVGTVAYHAEKQLDDLLYNGSGAYKDRQYAKATAITLNTMYEEIAILWDQEPKFRSNFSTQGDTVNLPVICAKISGVKNGNTSAYWSDVKKLITPDTTVIQQSRTPAFSLSNEIRPFAKLFFHNGKLNKDTVINHKYFKYGYLKDDVVDRMLDKLELLINSNIIKNTASHAVEQDIVSAVLNLPNDIVQRIQSFDLTKKNPKIVYINTTQNVMSLEESIVMAYLNLIGFDIIFFVPTGYQSVEKHFNIKIMEEHQIGQYIYDMTVPSLNAASVIKKPFASLRQKLFGK